MPRTSPSSRPLTSHSRSILLLVCLLAPFVTATSLPAQDLSIPIRWCVVEGAPAATDPQFVDEPDTDNVLWRRHERISEASFIPHAGITLRSSLWNIVSDPVLRFPVIPDQDTSNPNHQLGDVLAPFPDNTEFEATLTACAKAWHDDHGVENLGVLVVVARKILDAAGTGMVIGTGSFGRRRLIVEDNAFLLPASPIRRTNAFLDGVDANLGHEIGHALGSLWHVCSSAQGGDDANLMRQGGHDLIGNDGVLDNFVLRASTREVDRIAGHQGPDQFDCTADDTGSAPVDQIAQLRAAAEAAPGCKITGTNTPCSTLSDARVDELRDVEPGAPDLLRVTVSDPQNDPELELRLDLVDELILGDFASEPEVRAVIAVDLDADPETGGSPELLDLASEFRGAELLIDARIEPSDGEERFFVSPTAFGFTEGRFVELPAGVFLDSFLERRLLFIDRLDGSGSFHLSGDDIVIRLDQGFLPALPSAVRLQAFIDAGPAAPSLVFDRLDDRVGEPGLELRLRDPIFPTASVVPDPAPTGSTVELRAEGLLPNRAAKVFLGEVRVAEDDTDGSGALTTRFRVPSQLAPGPHLVTAGIKGTGLTAVTVLDVVEAFPDCNGNGADDAEDIATGTSQDVNGNGVPDECEIHSVAWNFFGIAQGGSVSITLAGFTATCTVTVPTSAGQSAADVVATLAAAINADPCMTSEGLTATASGQGLRVRGFLVAHVDTTATDPGLEHQIPVLSIPTLTPAWMLGMALLLLAGGWLALRSGFGAGA